MTVSKIDKVFGQIMYDTNNADMINQFNAKLDVVLDYHKDVKFVDVTSLIKDTDLFGFVIGWMASLPCVQNCDKIIGLESRGFIFASALAYAVKKPLILIRKKGKLPKDTTKIISSNEYKDEEILEVQNDDICVGDKVVLVDDVIATGGTAEASIKLLGKMGCEDINMAAVFELTGIKKSPDLREESAAFSVNYFSFCKLQ